jgi:parallel beta-helix repeat protein
MAESNFGRGFNGIVYGEAADEADNCTLLNCAAAFNGEEGIFGGDANTLTNCTSRGNGATGISMRDAATLTGCSMVGNGFGLGYAGFEGWSNVLVTDSTATDNSGNGIYFNTGVVANCTASANFYTGIEVFIGSAGITGSNASYNFGNGILLKESCKVENCTVTFNDEHGILADPGADPVAKACQIRNCHASRNYNDGIQVISASVVEGNHCEENGSLGRPGGDGAGIQATGDRNRIDGNHLVRNDRGIEVTATSSTILRNSASGNTDDYGSIVAGNDTAPIGTAAGSTNPWANLAF